MNITQLLISTKKNDSMTYPVSWAISRHVDHSIDNRVATDEKIKMIIQRMKTTFNGN